MAKVYFYNESKDTLPKADNLSFDKETSELQLLCEQEPIGDKVMIEAAGKSERITKTLAAASWTGSAAPFSYNLVFNKVFTATTLVEIIASATITKAQYEAVQAANIAIGTWAGDGKTLVIKAYGKKPTVAIPVDLIIRKDM